MSEKRSHLRRLTPIEQGCETCRDYSTKVHVGSVQPQSTMLFFPLSLHRNVLLLWVSLTHFITLSPQISCYLSAFLCHSMTSQCFLNFYKKNFALLKVQSASSKNYTEIKCSSASSRFYTFQKVRISRYMGLNMIRQNANIVVLSKEESISQNIYMLYFYGSWNVTMQFLLDLANAAVWGENYFQLAEVASFFLYPLYAWGSQRQAVKTRFIGYSPKKILQIAPSNLKTYTT